jgi:hypothetical protein
MFLSPLVMSMTVVVLLVGFCPYVSSSPTPSSLEQTNDINLKSNRLFLDPNDSQPADEPAYLSASVQDARAGSSPDWYIQPRAPANQFLMSSVNDNQILVPKQFTRFNSNGQTNDDDVDDADDYLSSNKRFAPSSNSIFSNLHKRKQSAKPPMEVMNEIVNSIYLKR